MATKTEYKMKINFRNLIYVVIVATGICGLCYVIKTSSWAGLIGMSLALAVLYVKYYPRLSKGFDAGSVEDIQSPEPKIDGKRE